LPFSSLNHQASLKRNSESDPKMLTGDSMALTLEQVAKLAEVSRSTVSRVINEHPNVRPEVRERVWQVIHTHDYQPHQIARMLVTGRTNTIGIIVPEAVTRLFNDPFFPQLTRGIAEVCSRYHYSLVLSMMTTHADRDMHYRRILRNGQLDGVIVASAALDDPLLPRLQQSRCPCVLVGRHPAYPSLPWVDVDNVNGARSMTEHLISLGHRRIAAITGPLNTIVGQERREGYLQALAQANIAASDALLTEGDFTEESGFYAMKRLARQEPTAVFAASDLMAIGAIRALAQMGRHVPEDVSVAGFDDAPAATLIEPQLTTVQQVVVDLGRMAGEKLLARLELRDVAAQPQRLSTHLVVRSSTRSISPVD
jgi:LacI family transcriptional regulator